MLWSGSAVIGTSMHERNGRIDWVEGSLDMFGTVRGTVVFFVCNEIGEAAEFDVAQPAVACVPVLQRRGEGCFRRCVGVAYSKTCLFREECG